MATTITYKGSDLTSFSNISKTLRTAGKYLEGDITVTAGLDVNNQNKTVIPSEATQSITADTGYTGLGTVTVNGITNTYVGSSVPAGSLTVSGPTVTASAGYYADAATATVPSATLLSYVNYTSANSPTVTIDSSGLVTATVNQAIGDGYRIVINPGYVSSSAYVGITSPARTTTYQLDTQAATTITPSNATQTITGQKYMTGDITVQPIPSQYIVPSGTLTISSVDTTTTFDATSYASVAVNLKNADVTAY